MTPKSSGHPLRIAIVGKSNRIGGGASKCSELMAESFSRLGHDVDYFTIHRPQPSYGSRVLLGRRGAALARRGHAVGRRWLGGEFVPFELPALWPWPERYDIVHVNDHWQAVSPWTIAWLSSRVPTALTLHDASYFTGGCLYPHTCARFEHGCGTCPQKRALGMWFDATSLAWSLKHRLLRNASVTLLAPSRWMSEMAARSPIVRTSPTVIVNCARRDRFHPDRRNAGRARLGLQPEDRAVLIGASSLTDPRKGTRVAADALNLLAAPSVVAVLLGHDSGPFGATLHTRSVSAGYLQRDEDLAEIYAAADIFLFPSLTDNCPLSVIESLACGTPVICFNRGGTPELIVSARDGQIVPVVSVEALTEALKVWLDSFSLDSSRRDTIAAAADRFDLDRYGREHIALYQQMLNDRHSQL